MPNIIYEKIENVAKITLNRADKLNSFTRPMASEMQEALDDAAADKNIRAIYITGAGRAFCAGQDLEEATGDNAPAIADIVRLTYNPIITKLREIEKPIIAAVNGVAAGAGANIALACDIVIAAENASFVQAFAAIGLVPDSGGTYILPRLIGWARATALMMTGEKVLAASAKDMGMIYDVVSAEELQDKAFALAVKLSNMPTLGLGLTKRCLNSAYDNDLTSQLMYEMEMQEACGNSYDYKEGVSAFLEKRKPEFKGE